MSGDGDLAVSGDGSAAAEHATADGPTASGSDAPSVPPSRRQAIVSTFGAGRRPVPGPPERPASTPVDEAQGRPGNGATGGRERTVTGPPTETLARRPADVANRPTPARPSAAASAGTSAAAAIATSPRGDGARRVSPSPTSAARLPGSAVRRRQVMTVYLPANARRHLYEAAERLGVPLGKAAMDALRGSYDVVRARLGTVDRSGPFPDERPRQRSRLDDPRGVSLSLSASQAEAVGRVLTELDCSASMLFSVALDVDASH